MMKNSIHDLMSCEEMLMYCHSKEKGRLEKEKVELVVVVGGNGGERMIQVPRN